MAQYYDLNMNGQFINNCSDPVAAQDVATMNYVDKRAIEYTGEGQIQYAGQSPFSPITLPIGTSGDVLTVAGTPPLPTWAPPTGASAPSGTLILNLGKINIQNQISPQPSVINYIPMWDGTSPVKQSGICTIGASNFTLPIDGSNQYTYLTWNGANPITVNLKLDCSWYSTANQAYPAGVDVEFTSTNAGNFAFAAVNFSVEIQELAAAIIQIMGVSLGSSSVIWQYSYGGTLSGTGFMKTGSYLRVGARTNYQFNGILATVQPYFANINFGGADQLIITAYESPYPV